MSIQDVVVQFSGGRDSTLAVAGYVSSGKTVHALRFQTGLGFKSDLAEFRMRELKQIFGDGVLFPPPIPAFGLVREIACRNLERDFVRYGGVNLILLGEKLAIHSYAVAYCRELGIPVVADGVTAYQSNLPEQKRCVVDAVRQWTENHEISYETPQYENPSLFHAIERLARLGLTPKTVEGVSMFANSSSDASDDVCMAYFMEKSELMTEFMREGIAFRRMAPWAAANGPLSGPL